MTVKATDKERVRDYINTNYRRGELFRTGDVAAAVGLVKQPTEPGRRGGWRSVDEAVRDLVAEGHLDMITNESRRDRDGIFRYYMRPELHVWKGRNPHDQGF